MSHARQVDRLLLGLAKMPSDAYAALLAEASAVDVAIADHQARQMYGTRELGAWTEKLWANYLALTGCALDRKREREEAQR
jgi:hypothetical protein